MSLENAYNYADAFESKRLLLKYVTSKAISVCKFKYDLRFFNEISISVWFECFKSTLSLLLDTNNNCIEIL